MNPKHAYIASYPVGPDLDSAVSLAAAYLREIGASNPILVANQVPGTMSGPKLKKLAGSCRAVVTPRNSNRIAVTHGHPVIAFAVDRSGLAVATQYAAGHPIVLVEQGLDEWIEWAKAVGARDLLRDTDQATAWSDAQKEILDAIDFAGNNSWGDAYGKRDLRRYLESLRDVGGVTVRDVVADQLSRGRTHALDYLAKEAQKILDES